MSSTLFSRRKLFEAGAAAAAGAGLAAIPGVALAQFLQDRDSELESLFPKGGEERFRLSQQNAYLFLDTMMDAYAQGSTTRLSQSYSDEIGLESTAFVYDNAVEIIARLLRGSGGNLDRAKVLGNGLLYAQQTDSAYIDRQAVSEEIATSKRLCAQHGWPSIDVSRRSIEETAAAVIALLQERRREGAGHP